MLLSFSLVPLDVLHIISYFASVLPLIFMILKPIPCLYQKFLSHSGWLSGAHIIPDVEQYLAHHSASEINSCAVGVGVNLLLHTSIQSYKAGNVLAVKMNKEVLQPVNFWSISNKRFWI